MNLNQEIINLKNELNNKNNIIEQQKIQINNLLNLLNNNNKNIYENKIKEYENEIIKLRNELNKKNDELKNLKVNIFDDKKYLLNKNEKRFAIYFISVDQKIHYPIACNSNDSIAKLEEIIYNEYPQYKEYNTYLTVNGRQIKRFKTIKENGIKEGNAITVNIYE